MLDNSLIKVWYPIKRSENIKGAQCKILKKPVPCDPHKQLRNVFRTWNISICTFAEEITKLCNTFGDTFDINLMLKPEVMGHL